MDSTPKPRVTVRRSLAITFAFVFVFFLIYEAYAITAGQSGSPAVSTQPENRDLSTEAYVVSQGFVKQALKAPSTADFPFLDYSVNKLNDSYRVSSYVDAQNSFGAKIRSDWMTILRYNSGDPADPNSWTLVEMVVDGQTVYPPAQ